MSGKFSSISGELIVTSEQFLPLINVKSPFIDGDFPSINGDLTLISGRNCSLSIRYKRPRQKYKSIPITY
jgi:hypothetical protein